MHFIKPDWNNNILNLSATLARYLGCADAKPVLPALGRELAEGYKNVIFLILDGFGMHPMRQTLAENAFLRRNVSHVLTSVFPSTTTNATTSFRSNLYPAEHGWFGWSMYFEELGRCVNLFPCVDSQTGEELGRGLTERLLPAPSFYLRALAEIGINVVVPTYWEGDEQNQYVWSNFSELTDAIEEICEKAGRQFVYAYCDQPDGVMHRFGVTSAEARETVNALNDGLERLASRLSDILLIVTADHGQIDISGEIALYEDEAILSLLRCPPYLEARATAFRVKEGCEESFRNLFLRKYGGDFTLFESGALVRENYFGPSGDRAELLGDFIAVGKTDKIMRLTPRSHSFKGHHTSLTEEEMLVPLILVRSKKNT